MPGKFKKLVALFLSTTLLVFIFGTTVYGKSYSRAYVDDTLAGIGTTIVSYDVEPLNRVIFDLSTPSGNVYSFPVNSDENGEARLSISGDELIRSGKYKVAIKNSTNSMPGPNTNFLVYPDSVSIDDSEIQIKNQHVSANDDEEALIEIELLDKYQNPIPYHEIKLISNRSADTFVQHSRNAFTDENGKLEYAVRSSENGRSEIFVYDMTDQKFLGEPLVVNFGSNVPRDVGGNFDNYYSDFEFETLSFGEMEFVFPNFPLELKVAEPSSFTLEIRDNENELVKNYEGTVHFSVPGAEVGDVVLPEDYEFTVDDQGVHTFPLSLQFQKEGTYKLIVQDIDDEEMLIEQDVVVGSGQASSLFNASGIEIVQPQAGTYANPSQVIQGKAAAGLNIKIYDNDKEIASTNTDIKGNFTYTTGPLTEGDHVIYAVSISSTGEIVDVSDDLNFKIDTSAPTINKVTLDPSSGANPGEFINIQVQSSEPLSQVIAQFEKDSIELIPVEGEANTYKGVLQAPNEFGTYPIDVTMVDSLSNQSTAENVSFVVVGSESKEAAFVADVTKLEAYASDTKVTLLWEEVQSKLPLKHYRIYYGESAELLNHIVDTHDSSNTWYIPNLANGKQYFFALTAIDEKGNESSKFSPTVSSVPFATVPIEVFEPFVEEQPRIDPIIVTQSPNVQGDTGPEVLYLLLFSALVGNLFVRRKMS